MKINELTSLSQTYTATVRVVLRGSVVNARTTVTTDTLHQARVILVRLFENRNVSSISQVMQESPRTSQIQARAANGVGFVMQQAPEARDRSCPGLARTGGWCEHSCS